MVASLFAFAPAHADEPVAAPSLRWQVSNYFHSSFSLKTHTLADGASEDGDGVVTFPDGAGSYNAATDTLAMTYEGSVSAVLVSGGAEQYRITVADPRVFVDADGEGAISAVVSASSVAQGDNPAASTDPKRVVVTTFDATPDDWSGDSRKTLAATPDWSGVLPADSQEATDLGIGAGKPVDGASFAPGFLGQLTPGVRAFFYQSAAGQTTKAPAAFTAEADPISVTPTITGADPASGLSLNVAGAGFTGDTKTGDAGVYVGLAPAGGLPDVSNSANIASFAGVAYVPGVAINGGNFSTSMTAPVAKLDPEQSYAVYTWQAHTHSNVSQDTETSVPIDFRALAPAVVPAASPAVSAVITSQSYANGVSVNVSGTNFTPVTNPGDAGVYVAVAPAGGLPDVSSQDGMAAFSAMAWMMPSDIHDGSFATTLNIPTDKLDPAKTYAVYTWQAHTHSNTGQDTQTALPIDFAKLVAPSTGPTDPTQPADPTQPTQPSDPGQTTTQPAFALGAAASSAYGKLRTIGVTVPGATGTVTLTGAGAAQVKTLVGSRATFVLPASLRAGRHTLTVSYSGDASHAASRSSRTITVAKAAAKVVAKVLKAPKVGKRGTLRFAVGGVSGAAKPAGTVVVTLTKGKAHKIVRAKVSKGSATVTLPKLAKGTWKAVAKYAGNANYKAVSKVMKLKVARR